jgi:Lhr-like helicase
MGALEFFSEPTRDWFARTFAEPTPAQEQGWPAIASGEHTLIQAPTGSGKTLAAFLYGIDRLTDAPGEGLRLLYVSPLKALNYDIERNLRGPLAGLRSELTVAVRTGDTPAKERAAMLGGGPPGPPPGDGARGDAAQTAGHPHHDPGVALSAADLAGTGDAEERPHARPR